MVGTIGAVATGIGQIIAQKKADERQRQWATEQQALAWKRNIEQWQRENQYNDPSAQMARLKKAGLNPNMVYGTGGAKTVSASSPKFSEASGQFNNPLGQLNPLALSNASIAQQQARSIKLENMKKEYDLGIRKPEWKESEFISTNPVTGNQVVSLVKSTDNLYYRRIKAKAEKASDSQEIQNLELKMRQKGMTFRDPLLHRYVATALDSMGIDPRQVTRKVITYILNKLGYSQIPQNIQ